MLDQERMNRLPPIVVDYIEKLLAEKGTAFQKENYCQILEGIRDAATEAIAEYKTRYPTKRGK